jgi:hypothetical protein
MAVRSAFHASSMAFSVARASFDSLTVGCSPLATAPISRRALAMSDCAEREIAFEEVGGDGRGMIYRTGLAGLAGFSSGRFSLREASWIAISLSHEFVLRSIACFCLISSLVMVEKGGASGLTGPG